MDRRRSSRLAKRRKIEEEEEEEVPMDGNFTVSFRHRHRPKAGQSAMKNDCGPLPSE